ncbi:unnamed protein product [Aphanomyces euteiches]
MVTKVGNDPYGREALENYKRECIQTPYIFTDEKEATALGASGNLRADDVAQAEETIKQAAIVLTQLETTMEALVKTLELAEKHNIPVILNPAPYQAIPDELYRKITYITPNETEAKSLTGIEIEDESSALLAAKYLFDRGVPHVIITLGKKGCYYYNGGSQGELYAGFRVVPVDTTGAGDAFNGGLAHALAEGQPMQSAILYANAVAALSVTKAGSSPAMPVHEAVIAFLKENA